MLDDNISKIGLFRGRQLRAMTRVQFLDVCKAGWQSMKSAGTNTWAVNICTNGIFLKQPPTWDSSHWSDRAEVCVQGEAGEGEGRGFANKTRGRSKQHDKAQCSAMRCFREMVCAFACVQEGCAGMVDGQV